VDTQVDIGGVVIFEKNPKRGANKQLGAIQVVDGPPGKRRVFVEETKEDECAGAVASDVKRLVQGNTDRERPTTHNQITNHRLRW
jgi:hypothetical protein